MSDTTAAFTRMQTLGAAVKALRDAEGWTQKELAGKIPGWTHSIVSATERGVRPRLGLDELEQMADAFDVDPVDLWRDPVSIAATAEERHALAQVPPLRDLARSLLDLTRVVRDQVPDDVQVAADLDDLAHALQVFVDGEPLTASTPDNQESAA